MRRDSFDDWDDRPRRGRRGARADEQWPADSDQRDSNPGRGSHRQSDGYPDPADRGYTDPGYGSRYGGSGYPDADYTADPGAGYGDPGYSGPGHTGYPADDYGQSGGYAGEAGYPDDGYVGPGYGGSGGHRAPAYGGTGPQDGYHDSTYPPGGYGDGSYAPADPYQAGPDGYGGRAGYNGEDSYGGAAGYNTGDPYASRDPYAGSDSGGWRGGQAGYERTAGAQYGGGLADRDFGPAAADPRGEYLRGASYGQGAEKADQYGWQDQMDTGVSRRRQRDPEDDFDPDSARHNGFFRGFGAPDDGVGHRPPRKRRGGAGMAAMLILIIFLAGIVGGGAYAYHWYTKRHADWTGSKGYGSVTVQVVAGEVPCSGAMENTLVSDGVVASASAFCNAAKSSSNPGGLQPGTFKLRKHMGAALAWALLLDPKSRVQKTVAVPDGLRVSKVLAQLANKTGIPYSQFESAVKKTSALGLPSWAKGNPEGFLWPATYPVQPGATALSILQTLVKQSTTEFTTMNLAAKAKAAHFTEYQVIIEASLLEAEVPPKYYTKVAKVIDNRLNMVPEMTLGLDSTVAYALNKYIYNLTTSDLNVNSPYNTTKHIGLPPGPIDSPDMAAILAVLHPASISDLYFVTINKQGLTEFTSDPNQFATWSAEAKRNGV